MILAFYNNGHSSEVTSMEDQQTISKERDLLTLLEAHFKSNSSIKHEDFERIPQCCKKRKVGMLPILYNCGSFLHFMGNI
jgi:hypothetical protein